MKFNNFFLFLILLLAVGCTKVKEDKNLIFQDYLNGRVFIGDTVLDGSEVELIDKINGIVLFYDNALNNLWGEQKIGKNHYQFTLLYSNTDETATYEKKFSEDLNFLFVSCNFIYNNIAVIRISDSYLLYDIVNDRIDIVECNNYGFLGFNGNRLFFTDGFYDIKKKEYLTYPNGEKVAYKSVYCPSRNVIVTYEKNKRISIFDPNTGTRRVLDIRVNKLNSRDDRSMYYLEGDKLYYSKHKFSFEELIPMLGYYYGMNWYEYDLKTGEKTKLKTPSLKSVIIGMLH